jgi:hypothetical protein
MKLGGINSLKNGSKSVSLQSTSENIHVKANSVRFQKRLKMLKFMVAMQSIMVTEAHYLSTIIQGIVILLIIKDKI